MIIGFDTETNEGPPITVQLYSDDNPRVNVCLFVNEKNVTAKVLKHIDKHCSGQVVLVGHNLKFDVLSLFWPMYKTLAESRFGDFEFTFGDWTIEGVYGQPTFCRLYKDGIDLLIVDGMSWFRGSLANSAKLLCPDLPKLAYPKGFGTTQYTAKDREFIAYAMRDAEVSYHQGVAVRAMCKKFDIDQPVSVADMASRVFTSNYIQDSAPIWNTGDRISEGAFYSYHGGRNHVAPGAAPAWHSHVDSWDLSSAYPHAMTLLPAFSKPNLFAAARVFSPRKRVFPEHGVYCVSGNMEQCNWPAITDINFKKITGAFFNTWITGYELNEARRIGEISLSSVWGHVYDTDKDPVTETAFKRYCDDFYLMKSEAENPIERFMYKTLLNSLYGKFIQKRQVDNPGGTGEKWKPGPLFHPFAASLITGHTRAVMHRLEHETQAIHTATDGVICPSTHSPADGRFAWAPRAGMGAIESEGKDLELALFRNKLYILYSAKPSDGKVESTIKPGMFIEKHADHGFQGTLETLENFAVTDERKYKAVRVNTLRKALKMKEIPNKFVEREFNLDVAPMSVRYNHTTRSSKDGNSQNKSKTSSSNSKTLST